MELIEGEDLAARLRRGRPAGAGEVARIGLDVARALGVAHVRGIVHRDVKPGNILLARDGRAMVTDFGIARLAADAEGAVPGTTLGSVHYFSPEQAKGATTTAASDVYSLGLVLYESLTGQRAWSGDTTAKLAAVRIGAPAPPSPRDVRPEVPAALDAIVVRALDPDPVAALSERQAMAAALEPVVDSSRSDQSDRGDRRAMLAAGGRGSLRPHRHLRWPPPLRPSRSVRPSPSGRPSRAAGDRRAARRPAVVVVAIVGPRCSSRRCPAWRSGRRRVRHAARDPDADRDDRPTRRDADAHRDPAPTKAPNRRPRPGPTRSRRAPACSTCATRSSAFACGLDAGTYEPTRFTPPIRFKIGNGWSVA